MDVNLSVKSNDKYRDLLAEIYSKDDIPKAWQDSPVESFILSQNCSFPIVSSGDPELVIITCIDFRYALPIPRKFAYVLRKAGGRAVGSEFAIGYTLAKGVKHLVLIGHNDCGMAKIPESAPHVVSALVNQGWSQGAAQKYVEKHGALNAMTSELYALEEEYRRLRRLFPKMEIAPLFVNLYDTKLYLPKWYEAVKKEEDAHQANSRGQVQDELIEELS